MEALYDWLLAGLISLGITTVLLRISRHSIAVAWRRPKTVHVAEAESGSRWRENSDVDFHRLFVQNREEIALEGNFELRIEVLQPGVGFDCRPRIFAGLETISIKSIPAQQNLGDSAVLAFRRLPSAATWVIEWRLTSNADVRIRLIEIEEKLSSGQSVTLSQVDSRALIVPRATLAGARADGSLGFLNLALSIGLGISTYELINSFLSSQLLQNSDSSRIGTALGIVSLAVLLMYFAVRRRPEPILQGYWIPSTVLDAPELSCDAGKTLVASINDGNKDRLSPSPTEPHAITAPRQPTE